MKLLRLLTLAAPLLFIGATNGSIEGLWGDEDPNFSIEFVSSGTAIMYNKQVGQSSVGRWERLDGNRISIQFPARSMFGQNLSAVCNFAFEGQDLVFSNCDLSGRLKRKR